LTAVFKVECLAIAAVIFIYLLIASFLAEGL